MKNTVKRLFAFLLTLALAFSLTSCDIVFEILDAYLEGGELGGDILPGGGNGGGSGGGTGTGDGAETGDKKPEEDKKVEILPDKNHEIDPENPYSSLHSGYNFTPASIEDVVWRVDSFAEIDMVFDEAIARGLEGVTLELEDMMGGYKDISELFSVYVNNSQKEMGHIKSYSYSNQGTRTTFTFVYDTETASFVLPKTEANTYKNYKNGNMIIRDYLNGESKRAADFDDFAIEKSNAGTMDVYNSESLWWALEHNYLPNFPVENTKAEAFYNEAKAILREIINDDMTDYEKTLAIYEYLVDMVSYDWDAYNAIGTQNSANNVCYFLEGVFEYKRAVCDGKSKAFVLLCRIEGIECVRDWGASLTGGAGHAWNYVKIDGTWYMVDTTAGDGATNFSSGAKAEIMDYSYFLCPVNTYKYGAGYGTTYYEYSGIWDSLLEKNNNDADISDRYFDVNVDSQENDFVINSYEELNYLIDNMFGATGEWIYVNYTLKFDPNDVVTSKNIHSYIKDAIDYTNVEYAIYDYTSDGYYLVVFTAK